MADERKQPAALQLVERRKNSEGKAANDDHLMPGLIEPVVRTFCSPKLQLTTRGVARRLRITNVAVETALFRDLFAEVRALREMVGAGRRAA